jgi:integrase
MLQVFINGDRWRTPIGVYIPPKYFDKESGLVKKNHRDAADHNLLIRKATSKANDIFVRCKLAEQPLNIASFKYNWEKGEVRHDFIHFFETSLEKRKGDIETGSYKYQSSQLRKLKKFSPRISFHELTPALLLEMKKWMKVKKNKPPTVWGFFKTLRTYVTLAKQQKIFFDDPFEHFKNPAPKPHPEFLDEDDIATLYKYFRETDNASHQKVLRYFLFSCLAGLRISDSTRVTHDQLVNGELHFVMYKGRKGNETFRLPLTDETRSLIITTEGKLFDTFTDPYTNRLLKEIAAHLKINKKLTYHVARHTFGYIATLRDVTTPVLKELMGHKNISTTMIYTHLVDKKKQEGMNRMSGLLTSG